MSVPACGDAEDRCPVCLRTDGAHRVTCLAMRGTVLNALSKAWAREHVFRCDGAARMVDLMDPTGPTPPGCALERRAAELAPPAGARPRVRGATFFGSPCLDVPPHVAPG